MKKLIIRYKDFILKVHISERDTCILNSYKVENYPDMKKILESIREEIPLSSVSKRSINSMVQEWRVHNLFYFLGIKRSRTASVNLEFPQPWYFKCLYFLFSPFYFHFK